MLHSEELHSVIMFISRSTRWVGHVIHMGETRNAFRTSVGKR